MKHLSLTILLLLFITSLYAQTFSKVIHLDLPTIPEDSADYSFLIRETIAVGLDETIIFGADVNKNFYLAMLDKDGEQIWGRRLELVPQDQWSLGFTRAELSLTPSGELLLCQALTYHSGEEALVVAKIGLDGNLIWSTQIMGTDFDASIIEQIGDDIYIAGTIEDSMPPISEFVLHLNQDGTLLSGKELKYPDWVGFFGEPNAVYFDGQLIFLRRIEEESTGPNPDNKSCILTTYNISTGLSSSLYTTIENNGSIFHNVYISDLAQDEEGNRYMSIVYGGQNLLVKYDTNNNALWCNKVDGYGSIILAEGQVKLLNTIPTIYSMVREGIISYSQATGEWLSSHYGPDYMLEPFFHGKLKLANNGHLLWAARPRDQETLSNLGLEGIATASVFRSDTEGQIEGCFVFEACEGNADPVQAPSFSPILALSQQGLSGLEQLPADINIEDQNFNILPYCSSPITFAAGFTFEDDVCPGDTIAFIPTVINSPTSTTTWVAEQAFPSTSTADTSFFQFLSSGTHEVHHIITLEGCNDTLTQTVEILPQPEFDLGDDTDLCEGDSLLLESGLLSGELVELFWQDSSTNSSYLVDATGLYVLQATNDLGCTRIDSIAITMVPNPAFSLGQDIVICEGESATLLPVPLPVTPQFEWNTGAMDDRLRVMQAGTYAITLTNQETGCFAIDSINLSVQNKPLYTYSPKDTVFCVGVGLKLEAISLEASSLDFTWLGEVPGAVFDVPSAGTYELLAEDDVCKDTLQITIPNGLCQADVYLPSAFSPNGDGRNDLFQAFGPDTEIVNLQVYNRWGSLVFESHDAQATWDGDIGDRKAEVGTYLYVLQYRNRLSLEERSIGGEFLLLR